MPKRAISVGPTGDARTFTLHENGVQVVDFWTVDDEISKQRSVAVPRHLDVTRDPEIIDRYAPRTEWEFIDAVDVAADYHTFMLRRVA